MSNQKIGANKTILILLVSLSAILATTFLGFQEIQKKQKNNTAARLKIEKEKTIAETSDTDYQKEQVKEFWSQGNQILITADSNLNKLEGTREYFRENYDQAQNLFTASLKVYQNDPETLIYLNNSKAVAQGNELTIGVSVPIGGNLSVAKEILRGVAQAQHKLNLNKGINDRLLKVIIANDNNEPELAEKIAREFVQEEEILAVIGHNASDSSIAAAPIYQKGGLVMITPTSSAKSLPEIGSYIYRATASTRALADLLADYVINMARKTNIAICVDNQAEASKSFKSDFTWAVYKRGGVINGVECDFSAADFNPTEVPVTIIRNGADALLLSPSLRYLNQAIDVAQANKQQLPLFGSHTMYNLTTLQQGQIDVNGLVLPVAWLRKPSLDNSFTQNAQSLWNETGSWRTAMSYDATQVIIKALQLSNSREQLHKVISNPKFIAEGASEPIRFMQNGDRLTKGVLVKVEPGEKSGTGYDFSYIEQN